MLKLTKYTNVPGTFEVEWFTREVIPATGTEGEEGYQPETTKDTTVRVIAYSGDQVALFRADVAQYGGEIDEALLAEIEVEWVPPPPPPPPVYTCSPWQIRKALNAQNLRNDVESAVAASNDQSLKDGWEFATEFRSDDPIVISMGAALGKTEEETEALIQYASTL